MPSLPGRPRPLSTSAPMSVFSDNDLAYLAEPRLGRLATIGPDGLPTSCPLGWSHNPARATIGIGGRNFARTRKFRNVQANPRGRPGDRRRGPAMAAACRHGPITVKQLL